MSWPEDDFAKPDNTDWDTLIEFEAMTNRGHWCAACGQEQPTETPCAECYNLRAYLGEGEGPDPAIARYTPQDHYSLIWLWRQ